jgi:hypothetical protein
MPIARDEYRLEGDEDMTHGMSLDMSMMVILAIIT